MEINKLMPPEKIIIATLKIGALAIIPDFVSLFFMGFGMIGGLLLIPVGFYNMYLLPIVLILPIFFKYLDNRIHIFLFPSICALFFELMAISINWSLISTDWLTKGFKSTEIRIGLLATLGLCILMQLILFFVKLYRDHNDKDIHNKD